MVRAICAIFVVWWWYGRVFACTKTKCRTYYKMYICGLDANAEYKVHDIQGDWLSGCNLCCTSLKDTVNSTNVESCSCRKTMYGAYLTIHTKTRRRRAPATTTTTTTETTASSSSTTRATGHVCSCLYGADVTGQPADTCSHAGEVRCKSCFHGYQMHWDGVCIPKCSCPHGTPTSSGCAFTDQVSCSSCDYGRNGIQCQPTCACPRGVASGFCSSPLEEKCVSCDDGHLPLNNRCPARCSCNHGVANDICQYANELSCRSCDDGFFKTNGECKAQCSCDNGAAADMCDTLMETKCVSCSDGFNLEGGICEPAPCSLPKTNMLPGLDCSCSETHQGDVVWSGHVPSSSCVPRCSCRHGEASVTGCETVGEERCESCDAGWFWLDYSCRVPCECSDGTPAASCLFPGEVKCTRCGAGFQLNAQQQCIPACSCPHGNPAGEGCTTPLEVSCSSCEADFFLQDGECKALCSCNHGTAAASCEELGETKCSACHRAYAMEGQQCVPAPCNLIGTNGIPGWDCDCKTGHQGYVQWVGSTAFSTCEPACTCLHGKHARQGCESVGDILCRECDAGYELIDGQCHSDCVCDHGIPARGCQHPTDHSCTRCNDGYRLDSDICIKAPCEVAGSNMLPGPDCECLELHDGNVSWVGTTTYGTCVPRCLCNNGHPSTGCAVGQVLCDHCNDGYVLVNGTCTPECSCPNGEPAALGCHFPGQLYCETCSQGYALQDEQCHPSCVCTDGLPSTNCSFVNETKCSRCDDGYTLAGAGCRPAECYVNNSKKASGNTCKCDIKNGFHGILTWHLDTLIGECDAIPCDEIALKENKPIAGKGKCSCKPGYSGSVHMSDSLSVGGLQVDHTCLPVPCDIAFAELVDDQWRCQRGFRGIIFWSGTGWAGECKEVRCAVDHAAKEGKDCMCQFGYYNRTDLWNAQTQNYTGLCSFGFVPWTRFWISLVGGLVQAVLEMMALIWLLARRARCGPVLGGRDEFAGRFVEDEKPDNLPPRDGNERTIVLMGQTGAGKSFLGNAFCDQNHFTESCGVLSATWQCNAASCKVQDFSCWMVDMAGYGDNRDELGADIQRGQFYHHCPHGLHAILFVFKGRFSESEAAELSFLERLYGETIFDNMFLIRNQIMGMDDNCKKYSETEAKTDLQPWSQKCGGRIFYLRWDNDEDVEILKAALAQHLASQNLENLVDIATPCQKLIRVSKRIQQMRDDCEKDQRNRAFAAQLSEIEAMWTLFKKNRADVQMVLETCCAHDAVTKMKHKLDKIHLRSHSLTAVLVWVAAALAGSLLPATLMLLFCAGASDTLSLGSLNTFDINVWWDEVKASSPFLLRADGPSWVQQCSMHFFVAILMSLFASMFGKQCKWFGSRLFGLWFGLEIACAAFCFSSLLSCLLGTASENPMAWVAVGVQIVFMVAVKVGHFVFFKMTGTPMKTNSSTGSSKWAGFMMMFPACAVSYFEWRLAAETEKLRQQHERDTSAGCGDPVLLPCPRSPSASTTTIELPQFPPASTIGRQPVECAMPEEDSGISRAREQGVAWNEMADALNATSDDAVNAADEQSPPLLPPGPPV